MVKTRASANALVGVTSSHAKAGRRERNRQDKRERIRDAAEDLFNECGYDAATTRDIARRADVSLGTLFNYADDKRDLIFLIWVDRLDRITAEAFAGLSEGDLLQQLLSAFGCWYRAFARQPALARLLLKELTFYSSGRLAADFQDSRRRTIDQVRMLVIRAQARGELRAELDPGMVSRAIFFTHAGAVRWWIAAAKPARSKGLAQLRALLTLQLDGMRVPTIPARVRRSGEKSSPSPRRYSRARTTL